MSKSLESANLNLGFSLPPNTMVHQTGPPQHFHLGYCALAVDESKLVPLAAAWRFLLLVKNQSSIHPPWIVTQLPVQCNEFARRFSLATKKQKRKITRRCAWLARTFVASELALLF